MKKVWTTAYDLFSTRIALEASVDALLVGDSLGMAVYGFKNTQSVTKELMLPHVQSVLSYAENTRVIVDLPYGSDRDMGYFLETLEFFAEKNVKEFKLELTVDNFPMLLEARSRGYTMVAHLGYLPQNMDIPKVYGKTDEEAETIVVLAKKADVLGVSSIVLECIPALLAKKITEMVEAEVIGIGAGIDTDGQVLVFDDIIGKTDPCFTPKFLRRFGEARAFSLEAMQQYVQAVKTQSFPSKDESYL